MGFEKFSKGYFGSNLEMASRNYETGVARKKLYLYPSADAKNFVFDADLSKTGDLIRTFAKYRDKEDLFDITGYLFKKFYANKLYWQPRIWDPNGTVQPLVLNMDPLPLESLRSTSTKRKVSCFTLRPWKHTGGEPSRTSLRWPWTRTTLTLHPFWPRASSPTWVE